MIRAETGEFKLDDYKLIIQPGLSFSEFKGGDIPISGIDHNEAFDYAVCSFAGVIDRLDCGFCISFDQGRLQRISFDPKETNIVLEKHKTEMQAALKRASVVERSHILEKWTHIINNEYSLQKNKNSEWLKNIIGHPPPYEYNWGSIATGEGIGWSDDRAQIIVTFKKHKA